jgi:hypothetical protein
VAFVLPAAPDAVVPTLATDGAFEPPQPDASNERPTSAPTNNEQRVREPIDSKTSTAL